MQLRKVCSHPYLFHWPTAPGTSSPEMSSAVSSVSGKMLLLNRLLDALFARKHKVLIFSQFTRMLDIIEDWATEVKGWDSCRIDGTTSPQDRREQMNRFNSGGEGKGACRLFLLSTRAGGLGINLVTADTVIFYDQDWVGAHRHIQTAWYLLFVHRTRKWICRRRIVHTGLAKQDLCLFSVSSQLIPSKRISWNAHHRSGN